MSGRSAVTVFSHPRRVVLLDRFGHLWSSTNPLFRHPAVHHLPRSPNLCILIGLALQLSASRNDVVECGSGRRIQYNRTDPRSIMSCDAPGASVCNHVRVLLVPPRLRVVSGCAMAQGEHHSSNCESMCVSDFWTKSSISRTWDRTRKIHASHRQRELLQRDARYNTDGALITPSTCTTLPCQ